MIDLYRMYDRAGRLLYIGISGHAGSRATQHAEDKPWWPQVDHITIEHLHCDRQDALKREEWAIRGERPKYNKVHNVTDRYLQRPVPVTPYDTPYELLVMNEWHSFKKALLDLCWAVISEQRLGKLIDAVDYDVFGLVRSMMLAAHHNQFCPQCDEPILPDIVRFDRDVYVSTDDRRCNTGSLNATVVSYCNDCKVWASPARINMSEPVDAPRSFPSTKDTPST